jgi:hypothetical protein
MKRTATLSSAPAPGHISVIGGNVNNSVSANRSFGRQRRIRRGCSPSSKVGSVFANRAATLAPVARQRGVVGRMICPINLIRELPSALNGHLLPGVWRLRHQLIVIYLHGIHRTRSTYGRPESAFRTA